MSTKLPYAHLIGAGVLSAIIDLAQWLGVKPDWLLIVMHKESGLRPGAVNKYSGASGLIQFMPGTAVGLGTTVQAIRRMDGLQQLVLVKQYYAPYRGRLHSLFDTYFAVFYPKAIGQPVDFVLFARGSKAYQWNKALDMNHNGVITVGDVKAWLMNYLPDDYDPCGCDCH